MFGKAFAQPIKNNLVVKIVLTIHYTDKCLVKQVGQAYRRLLFAVSGGRELRIVLDKRGSIYVGK